MSQADELKRQLESLLVAQGGAIFALMPDGSQVRIDVLPATRENMWTEQVLINAIRAIEQD